MVLIFAKQHLVKKTEVTPIVRMPRQQKNGKCFQSKTANKFISPELLPCWKPMLRWSFSVEVLLSTIVYSIQIGFREIRRSYFYSQQSKKLRCNRLLQCFLMKLWVKRSSIKTEKLFGLSIKTGSVPGWHFSVLRGLCNPFVNLSEYF